MTKTEAAAIIAIDVRVFARTYGLPVTRDLVVARMSECHNLGGQKATAAAVAPSWRTVLREATKVAL